MQCFPQLNVAFLSQTQVNLRLGKAECDNISLEVSNSIGQTVKKKLLMVIISNWTQVNWQMVSIS